MLQHDVGHRRHQRRNLSGQEIGQTWSRATIRHVREIRQAGFQLEQFTGEVIERTVPSRAPGHLAWIGLDVGNQLLEVRGRHRRMNRDRESGHRNWRDRLEILERIVGRLGLEQAFGDVGRGAAEQQRVAVRPRMRRLCRADAAAGAANVLDRRAFRTAASSARPRAGRWCRTRRPEGTARSAGPGDPDILAGPSRHAAAAPTAPRRRMSETHVASSKSPPIGASQ